MKLEYFTYTDIGPRSENQDSFSIVYDGNFLKGCVADGVGGTMCGKRAAEMATSEFRKIEYVSLESLKQAVLSINEVIKSLQKQILDCRSMATTLTGCLIADYLLSGVHVGDSRLCILRGNGIKQLTESHTEGYMLYKKGKLNKQEYLEYPRNNILESALGIVGQPIVQLFKFGLLKGDRVIITTDGVHDIVSKTQIRDLSVRSRTLERFGNELTALLRNLKLTDNATFLVIEVLA